MLKKTIAYKDLDDNPVEDTFWFHMSKAELAEMALGKEGKEGGFEHWVKTLINSNDGEVIVKTFKKILLSTVGQRSSDNRSFMKSDEIRQHFEGSEAYSILFMELVTDHDKMSEFINGVMPKDMRDQVMADAKQVTSGPDISSVKGPEARTEEKRTPPTPVSERSKDDRPDWLKEGRVPTEQELKGASQEHILEAFKLRSQQAGPVTQEKIEE